MKPLFLSLSALMALFSFSPVAGAAEAYTTTAIHMRAGPDADFPIVATLQRGERIELLDCIEGAEWCEVETSYGERGWTASYYLQTSYNGQTIGARDFAYDGGTRIVIFQTAPYWDRYYRNKSFYKNRDQWSNGHNNGGNHGGGHHSGNNGNDDEDHHNHTRPAPVVQKPVPPKYQKQPIAGKGYNPLCKMGQNNC